MRRAGWRAGAIAALVVVAVTGAGRQAAAQFPGGGPYSQADIKVGAGVFAAQCVVCHGATGNLVAGIDLRNGRFKRVTNDADLVRTITTGVEGTAMPPFKFTPAELTGVVAYVRNMRDFDAKSLPTGDAARGRSLFEGAGRCATCHRVNGKGPRLAPDLSRVGTLRTADAIERAVVDPSSAIQFDIRSIRAVTKDGRTITGRRLNEDTYTVQIIDDQERLLSLEKTDLREYAVVTKPTMPSYKETMSTQDISDVVTYLLTLRGPQ
jgi:putative heme-binding domain-containing protein